MKIKIGANIKAIRKSRGMTQEQLAEKLGVVKATISSWEIDRTQVKMENVVELCEALGCQSDDLIGKSNQIVSREITNEEWDIILKYRETDNLNREAVKRLLSYKED